MRHTTALMLLAAALLANRSLAATQQDWDECAGQDVARSAPACSRIIAEQSASAQDRADAYLYRGNASLMQDNADAALADYSAAIRLAPGNVVAYASRALTHLRKGDRAAALADYISARAIDAAKLQALAAATPDLAALAEQLRRRSWLGVKIQTVTDATAESLGIKPARGALVAGVEDGSPARSAGIQAGDVIVRFDGRPVNEMRDLPGMVAATPDGKVVEVVVLRKGGEVATSATIAIQEENLAAAPPGKKDEPPAQPPVVRPAAVPKVLGLDLADMSNDLRQRYRIKGTVQGVVITGVEAGSAAAEKRLAPGDVVVEVWQEAVKTAAELQKSIDELKRKGRRTVLLRVSSADGESRFVALPLQ